MGGLASTSTFIVVAIVPANANVHVDVHRRRAPPSTSPPPLHAPILGVRDFGRSISPRLCRASGGRRCVFPRGLGEGRPSALAHGRPHRGGQQYRAWRVPRSLPAPRRLTRCSRGFLG